MHFSLSTLAALLAALAAAVDGSPARPRTPTRSRPVLHERRADGANRLWTRTARADPAMVLPVRIGLAQQNLELGEEYLMDVSHPTSANYGRHWTADEVADAFAPPPEAVAAVRAWLAEAGGLGGTDRPVRLSRGRNWLAFNATVSEVEQLLQTEYHVYRHAQGHERIACDAYHVPEHVREHVDLVLPTVQMGGRPTRRQTPPAARRRRLAKKTVGAPTDASLPKQGATVENALMSLDQCDTMITPACLRALYRAPKGTRAAANNSMGIVEYTPQAFLQTDLDLFFGEFAPKLRGNARAPVVQLLDGAVVQTDAQSFSYNGESALDLEFAMALVAPQTATLYQVGDTTQGGSFDTLLDALDGSFCTADGGDDTTVDPRYNASTACGVVDALPHVLSTSYSYDEADLTAAYARRQCAEYLKLGLRGVTVLYSSGDYGVAGNGGTCLGNNDTVFRPSFPGTCPYVTSVGATELPNGTTVRGAEAACQTVIASGGGFSNVFAMPAYQADAVATYYRTAAPAYGADRYNNSQAVRGYPDVSANGANFLTAVDGSFTLSYGTSASAPTFAAILNLINERRLAAGKSVLGFVNPVLYANPSVLTDISAGSNPGCGTDGFTAVAGWDPLTGLGTPNYPAMEKLWLSLP